MKKYLLLFVVVSFLLTSFMSEYYKSVYGFRYKPRKNGCAIGRKGSTFNY